MIKHSNSYNLLERVAISWRWRLYIYSEHAVLSLAPRKRHRVTASISWSDEDGNEDGSDSSSGGNNVGRKAPGSNLSEEFFTRMEQRKTAYILSFPIPTNCIIPETCGHGELHAPPPNAA